MSSVLFRGGKIITATGIFDGEVLTKGKVICDVSGRKVSGEGRTGDQFGRKIFILVLCYPFYSELAGDFMDRTAGGRRYGT